jgi:hypothetical protein
MIRSFLGFFGALKKGEDPKKLGSAVFWKIALEPITSDPNNSLCESPRNGAEVERTHTATRIAPTSHLDDYHNARTHLSLKRTRRTWRSRAAGTRPDPRYSAPWRLAPPLHPFRGLRCPIGLPFRSTPTSRVGRDFGVQFALLVHQNAACEPQNVRPISASNTPPEPETPRMEFSGTTIGGRE